MHEKLLAVVSYQRNASEKDRRNHLPTRISRTTNPDGRRQSMEDSGSLCDADGDINGAATLQNSVAVPPKVKQSPHVSQHFCL